MTDEEFLKFVPTCAGCGEVLHPAGHLKAFDLVVVRKRVRQSDGSVRVMPRLIYHNQCAPGGYKAGHLYVEDT